MKLVLNAFCCFICRRDWYAVWLWTQGLAALGVIAATTAMILKLNSMAEFMMWHMSALFENVGTIQDGMQTLGKKINIQDKPEAKPLAVKQVKSYLKMSLLPITIKMLSITLIYILKQVKRSVLLGAQVQVSLLSSNYFYTSIILKKVQF